MKNNILYILILIFTPLLSFAQKDTLLELGVNKKIISERHKEANNEASLLRKKHTPSVYKKASSLPFFDDFAQQEYYPDGSKWIDIAVYKQNFWFRAMFIHAAYSVLNNYNTNL